MEDKKNLTASVTRHNVTKDDIKAFVKESIVKFIFLGDEYSDISSDETVNEIHKFKSVYRGNTYIRVPLMIVKGEDDKYAKGIEIDKDAEEPHGFAVISKHVLRDLSPEMKKLKKEQIVEYAENLCAEYVAKLNKYLSNNILIITVSNSNKEVITTKLITGGSDFATINKEILSVIENVNKNKVEMI